MAVIRLGAVSTEETADKKQLEVEGLLTNLEEVIAKNGNPFVRGTIKDKNVSIAFKHWDITLEDMYNRYNIPKEKKSFVVQIRGLLDFYEDIPQVIVKGGMCFVTREGAVNEYVDTPPFPVANMVTVVKNTVNTIGNEGLKSLCTEALSRIGDKIEYYPYSCDVHGEKGGWLYHLYNLFALKASDIGEPKLPVAEGGSIKYVPVLNKDIILTAYVLSSLCVFDVLTVDTETGAIEEKDELSLMSLGWGSLNLVKAVKLIDEFASLIDEDTKRSLIHIVSAMNGNCEATTPEAVYCCGMNYMSLKTHAITKTVIPLKRGEKARYSVNGKVFTSIKS